MSSQKLDNLGAVAAIVLASAVALGAAGLMTPRKIARYSELETLILMPGAQTPEDLCQWCDGTGENLELTIAPFCSTCKGTGLKVVQSQYIPSLKQLGRQVS
jgi:hypothetical protein